MEKEEVKQVVNSIYESINLIRKSLIEIVSNLSYYYDNNCFSNAYDFISDNLIDIKKEVEKICELHISIDNNNELIYILEYNVEKLNKIWDIIYDVDLKFEEEDCKSVNKQFAQCLDVLRLIKSIQTDLNKIEKRVSRKLISD